MMSSTGDLHAMPADATRRLIEIQGAASAAVSAVGRLSTSVPGNSDLMLEEASLRLASGIRNLQKAVERLVDEQERALPETGKWQKRYHSIERERDSLQDMLIALKSKYEHLQKAYHELGQAHDRKVDEAEAMQLKLQDASERLGSTMFLLDVMMRDDHDDHDEAS